MPNSKKEMTAEPQENLHPELWTLAEAQALEGRRLRLRDGSMCTVRTAYGLLNGANEIFTYGIEVTSNPGPTILWVKADFESEVQGLLPDAPCPRTSG